MGIRIGTRNYYREILADNPVAYWRLGEPNGAATAIDEKGLYNGTYVGSPQGGVVGALVDNTAVTFNGSSQYIKTSASPLPSNPSAFTIEFWVKASAQDAKVIATVQKTDDTNPVITVTTGISSVGQSTSSIRFAVRNNAGTLHFGNGTGDTTGSGALDNTWKHVAMTFDGSVAKGYLNGSLVFTSSSFTLGATTLNIASFAASFRTSAISYFSGALDEIAIYSTALSPEAILRHYRASL